MGVAHHQVDVFLFEPRTDRYLGRLCHFGACPKEKPECRVAGCGAALFLRQHERFVFDPRSLESGGIVLFDREGACRRRLTTIFRSELERVEATGIGGLTSVQYRGVRRSTLQKKVGGVDGTRTPSASEEKRERFTPSSEAPLVTRDLLRDGVAGESPRVELARA